MRHLRHVVCGDGEDGNACPINNIIYCYAIWQPEFDEFLPHGVKFVKGFNSPLLGENYMKSHPHTLLLIDDCAYEAPKNFLSDCFTRFSHHYKWSIAYQVHNIFTKMISDQRTTALNSSYTLICASRRCRDSVGIFASQVFRGSPKYLKVFNEVYEYMLTKDYASLLIDTHPRQTDPRLMLRMNLFYPYFDKEPMSIFFPPQ